MTNERYKMFNEIIENSFYSLTPEEQETIDEMVYILTNKVKNLGVKSAIELLAKIGILQANRNDELVRLLDKVERETMKEKHEKKNSVGTIKPSYYKTKNKKIR
jgi:hypothetical protein